MSQITGVEVGVTMGQIRTIQVFVIGKVAQPGLYTVSALSHVSNALDAAGGISKMGSLRKIELRRDDRVETTIDLYDLLLHGDTRGDVRLKPRDVIFVPVIGPVAAVTGDVKSPAIYEMLGNESLGNLLRMAGGVTAFGYSERLQVERVQNHEKRIALDVNLNQRSAGQFPIDDGDLVKVFSRPSHRAQRGASKGQRQSTRHLRMAPRNEGSRPHQRRPRVPAITLSLTTPCWNGVRAPIAG